MRAKYLRIWIALLLGVGIFSYPWASRLVNQRGCAEAIRQFDVNLEDTDKLVQRSLAESYNLALLRGEKSENYEEILNISNGMMGYLKIPKIHVSLPIYHGTGADALRSGIGHLPESAFPIGGEGNHSVLTGHTGLPSARLLTDLRELETGDQFYISILGDMLTYQVEEIQTVLPEEAEALTPVPGEDQCTLVTCTPYGINSHRLLVTGKRQEKSGR